MNRSHMPQGCMTAKSQAWAPYNRKRARRCRQGLGSSLSESGFPLRNSECRDSIGQLPSAVTRRDQCCKSVSRRVARPHCTACCQQWSSRLKKCRSQVGFDFLLHTKYCISPRHQRSMSTQGKGRYYRLASLPECEMHCRKRRQQQCHFGPSKSQLEFEFLPRMLQSIASNFLRTKKSWGKQGNWHHHNRC